MGTGFELGVIVTIHVEDCEREESNEISSP